MQDFDVFPVALCSWPGMVLRWDFGYIARVKHDEQQTVLMMFHPAIRAYQSVTATSMSDRETEAVCFRMLVEELEAASIETDGAARERALAKHQRFWSMIMKANMLDNGYATEEERKLFVRLADQAQRYGIQAILDPELALTPLIEIAENVLAGLEAVPEGGR